MPAEVRSKVGRPPIGPEIALAFPAERQKDLARLARRRRVDLAKRGARPLLLRIVLDAGFEALRSRGEL